MKKFDLTALSQKGPDNNEDNDGAYTASAECFRTSASDQSSEYIVHILGRKFLWF